MSLETTTDLSSRLLELDGLRGVLALWVALAHIASWTGFWELPFKSSGLASPWQAFVLAYGAVDTFMILSGFAITFLIHRQRQSYGRFIAGRFFRLYPVYITCLSLGMLTAALSPFILAIAEWHNTEYFVWLREARLSEESHAGAHLFWHLSLLHGIIPNWLLTNSTNAFLPPAWSITLEWQYYLAAPVIAVLIRTGLGVIALTLVSCIGIKFGGAWENIHQAFLPAQLPLFLLGAASYHYYDWCQKSPATRPYQQLFPAVLLAVALITGWHMIALTAWAIAFGCVFTNGTGVFSKFLATVRSALKHPGLLYLGKISYPLYLVHWPIIIILVCGLLRYQPSLSAGHALFWMICLGLPVMLLTAHVMHVFIELPAMRYGKRFSLSPARAVTLA